nr:WG repeat-containing protein [Elizabethkingia ursingii]
MGFSQSDLKLQYDLRDKLKLDIDRFEGGYAVFKKGSLSGIIDSTGTVTLQPINGNLVPFRKGYFFHYTGENNNRKVGLIDFKGDYKIPLNNYDFGLSWNSDNGYLVVSKNKKFGLVNYLSEKSELDFLYDSIEYAGESMFFVKKNNKWAIYNPKKGFVSDFAYQRNSYFNKDKSCVQVAPDKYFLVDKENKILLKSKYELIDTETSNDYFVNLNRNIDKEGLIDSEGKEVLPMEYSHITIYGDYAIMDKSSTQFFLFNLKTKENKKIKAGSIAFLFDKYFLLNEKKQVSIIDDSLNKVVNESFDRVTFISTDKLQYLITEKNKINNLLNKNFQQIFPDGFTIYALDENQLVVKNKIGYQRLEWNTWKTEPLNFDEISPAFDSFFFRAQKNIGLIAKKGGKYGFIELSGKEILPFVYEEIAGFRNNMTFVAKLNGKYGLINNRNEIIRPFVYDSYAFSKEYMYLSDKGKKEIISTLN